MTLIRKFAGYSALVTAALAVAISLMLATTTASNAAVNSLTASPTTVDAGDAPGATLASRTATITVDADNPAVPADASDVRIVSTSGTIGVTAAGTINPAVLSGGGTNDATVQNLGLSVDATGLLDLDNVTAGIQGGIISGTIAGVVTNYTVLGTGMIDVNGDGVITAADDAANFVILGDQWDIIDGAADTDEDADTTAEAIAAGVLNTPTDTFQFTFVSPATGPGTATITVIQGSSVKTIDIKYRGPVSTISLVTRLQTAAGAPAISATMPTTVIRSTTATAPGVGTNALAANLRAQVADSAGNGLNGVTVSFITTDGSLVDGATLAVATGAAVTATGGNLATGEGTTTRGVANAVSLIAGTTGLTGDTATVTANAAGKTATADVKFGGNATACTVTAEDTSVNAGGSTAVTAKFTSDANGTPIPDYATIGGAGTAANDPAIAAVNAVGAGTFLISGVQAPVAGEMKATLTVGASGGTGVLATMGGTSVTCNTTVVVTTAVEPPTDGDGGGEGEFSGDIPNEGSALVTFTGDFDGLIAAAEDAGVLSIAVTVDGEWVVYIVGAPDFVNEEFMDALGDETFSNDPFSLLIRD